MVHVIEYETVHKSRNETFIFVGTDDSLPYEICALTLGEKCKMQHIPLIKYLDLWELMIHCPNDIYISTFILNHVYPELY